MDFVEISQFLYTFIKILESELYIWFKVPGIVSANNFEKVLKCKNSQGLELMLKY